jgi:predicted ATP-dependent endonuclease of OLD family
MQQAISFKLSKPWSGGQFELEQLSPVTFLAGPTGSGKLRFATQFQENVPRTRLVRVDRPLREEALEILEERDDVRSTVESVLGTFFDENPELQNECGLEKERGATTVRLSPSSLSIDISSTYRFDRNDTLGIREFVVLLGHLYGGDFDCIIIDVPEFKLHPKLQSLFMEQVRQVTGPLAEKYGGRKVIIATRSPYILDLPARAEEDSIIYFPRDHSMPMDIRSTRGDSSRDLYRRISSSLLIRVADVMPQQCTTVIL